jgi:kynurenine 3-monooxygenase
MSNRGWKTLEDIGLDDGIRYQYSLANKRGIHLQDGSYVIKIMVRREEAIFSLSRGILNRKMIDLAEKEGVNSFF